ncbi:YIF1-domain-containing protein [Abortiporus biennis]|nr:YIF1-domain-containing protein [Abortiporus biennis]
MSYYSNNRSPPPLQHPVPTHPAYIPEPPSTPVSPQGYQRYTSSPTTASAATQQAFAQPVPPYAAPGAPPFQTMGSPPRGGPSVRGQMNAPSANVPTGPVDFSAWGLNDATAQFGMQLGQSAVAAGQDYVSRNLGGLIPVTAVKHHFNVSNSYVISKLRLLIFPWRHKPWSRRSKRTESGQAEWLSPRDDINSPDLYIPAMAFVTYILLAALNSGLQSRFHPEILGVTASTALVVLILDFAFIKFGCYILNIQGASQVLDLLAYDGYKFVGVIVTLLAGLLQPGRTVYFIVFIYSFLATAFFLLRSLRSVVLPDASSTPTPTSAAQRSRRITFLFLLAVSQIFYMAILIRV